MKNQNKPFGKNPFIGKTIPVSVKLAKLNIPRVRIPRGPTVRWSIDYDKLFKKGEKK